MNHRPVCVLLLLSVMFTGGCKPAVSKKPAVDHDPSTGENLRILSLSPSITEVLFALDLGSQVVGVTRYCTYPPEATEKPDVGGYLDPNYEAIVRLKPNLVIILRVHEDALARLDKLGIPALTVNHDDLDGIIDSISLIGNRCGAKDQATAMVARLRAGMTTISKKVNGLPQPNVLITVHRSMGTGKIGEVWVAGNDGFYSRLLELAGAKNACPGLAAKFPTFPAEAVLRLNPQIIIEMVPDLHEHGLNPETIKRDWQSFDTVDAVRNRRVHIFSDSFGTHPGPRLLLLLELMAKTIHPELEWND